MYRRSLALMTHGAEIRFLEFFGRRVAYSVTGNGPPLVAPAWWVSHVELDWADQTFRGFWESVGEGYAVVRYDRLGVGMSDRDLRDEELTLDGEVALLRAVLDELGLERVLLVGGSSGGCAAIAFAARFPDRVDRLLLLRRVCRRVLDHLAGGARGDRLNRALALGARVARAGRHIPRRS